MGIENKFDENKFLSSTVETLGAVGTVALEEVRTKHIHPSVNFENIISRSYNAPIEVSGLSKEILQHVGDFWEGYIYPFILYNSLSFLFPKMSERTKLGISLGLTNLVIAAVESGFVTGQKPDYADIPAGVIGSLAYAAVHYLGKNIANKISTTKTSI